MWHLFSNWHWDSWVDENALAYKFSANIINLYDEFPYEFSYCNFSLCLKQIF